MYLNNIIIKYRLKTDSITINYLIIPFFIKIIQYKPTISLQ